MKNLLKISRKTNGLVIIFTLACLFFQCEKESTNPKYVPPKAPPITHPNDFYLYSNNGKSMYEKYNIANKWKWNDNFLAVTDRATPIKSKYVIPVAKILEYMWIGVFESIGEKGKLFFKKMKVGELQYIGSYIYRRNSRVLGFAEAGASISLLNLNNYNLKDRNWLASPQGGVLATIHHEFAHTIHQKNNLPKGFNKISEKYLGNGWTNVVQGLLKEHRLDNVIKLGMVRNYATMNEYEDFCEIISHYLTMKKEDFIKKFITHIDCVTYLPDCEQKCDNHCETVCLRRYGNHPSRRAQREECEKNCKKTCKVDCEVPVCEDVNKGRTRIKRKVDMVIAFYKKEFDVDLVQVRDTLQKRLDYVLKHNKIPG